MLATSFMAYEHLHTSSSTRGHDQTVGAAGCKERDAVCGRAANWRVRTGVRQECSCTGDRWLELLPRLAGGWLLNSHANTYVLLDPFLLTDQVIVHTHRKPCTRGPRFSCCDTLHYSCCKLRTAVFHLCRSSLVSVHYSGFQNRNNGGINVNTMRMSLIHFTYVNQYSIYAVMTRARYCGN